MQSYPETFRNAWKQPLGDVAVVSNKGARTKYSQVPLMTSVLQGAYHDNVGTIVPQPTDFISRNKRAAKSRRHSETRSSFRDDQERNSARSSHSDATIREIAKKADQERKEKGTFTETVQLAARMSGSLVVPPDPAPTVPSLPPADAAAATETEAVRPQLSARPSSARSTGSRQAWASASLDAAASVTLTFGDNKPMDAAPVSSRSVFSASSRPASARVTANEQPPVPMPVLVSIPGTPKSLIASARQETIVIPPPPASVRSARQDTSRPATAPPPASDPLPPRPATAPSQMTLGDALGSALSHDSTPFRTSKTARGPNKATKSQLSASLQPSTRGTSPLHQYLVNMVEAEKTGTASRPRMPSTGIPYSQKRPIPQPPPPAFSGRTNVQGFTVREEKSKSQMVRDQVLARHAKTMKPVPSASTQRVPVSVVHAHTGIRCDITKPSPPWDS